jgi:serine/threonine protein kinase/tetratricopeptide (TPR) repeat protein
MNPPKGAETIFGEAFRLPHEARAAYLAQVTSGNPQLRDELDSLLQSYSAGEFLERAAAPEFRPTAQAAVTERPGDTIGRYKLLQQIGEGGCGVVYMAEQSEPVHRRVALKIIKLGMDTKSVIARFEAERQALALMDHPNIAKVLDAGATETGRPYFVMELVRGVKITEYCDEKKLSTRERLDLFIQVCHAIQHAHQKGIIHRDIKPSNILVSNNDGVAAPKVIDFGIVKATGGQILTEKTLFTAFEQFIGTPAYMSPEQALISNVDIDTRSDIYAMGVLLYELLTGKTPFDTAELLASGLEAMRRTIREQEPSKPSTRITEIAGADVRTLSSSEHGNSPQRRDARRLLQEKERLASELRGDLDWIVMKAIEKDRSRRYESANGLTSDIQRHLHNEPVLACPPSNIYRLRKTIHRHKTVFAAGIAVAASLVIGATLSTVLFFRAARQAAIAKAVSDFLQEDLLRQASSFSQARSHFTADPNLTVRTALDRAAERIGDRFKGEPLQEAAVRSVIGEALTELGQAERGVPQLQRALELHQAQLGSKHRDTLTSMHKLAWGYASAGKMDLALPLIDQALKLQRATLGANHPDTLNSLNLLGGFKTTDNPREALALWEELLRLAKAKFGPEDPNTLAVMSNLASCYRDLGKLDQAIPLYEQTFKLRKARLGPDHPVTLLSMDELGIAYGEEGKFDEALSVHEEALRLTKARLGPDHPETLITMHNLAMAYKDVGKLDQAILLYEQTLKLRRTRPDLDPSETVKLMSDLATAYHETGNDEQALTYLEEAVKVGESNVGLNPLEMWKPICNLALLYKASAKPEQARLLGPAMLKALRAAAEKDDAGALNTLAWLMATSTDPSLRDGQSAVRAAERALARSKTREWSLVDTAAAAYAEAGEFREASDLEREAISLVQDAKVKEALGDRLKLYDSNTPFRE